MTFFVPVLAVSVVLHAGHQQVPLAIYLSRVLAILLAFAFLAVGIYCCLDAVEKRGRATVATHETAEADR